MRETVTVFRFQKRAIVLLALLGCSASSYAQSSALTLEEAVRLATDRSAEIVAASASATAAREMAIAAREAPDPTLSMGLTNVPVDGPEDFSLTRDFMTMRTIGVSQELTRSAKRDARALRFRKEAEAADATRTLARAEVQREAALAWIERWYRERAHAELLAQRAQAALQVAAADAAFGGGSASQPDVLGARLAVAKIDDAIAANERDIEVAAERLARWTGVEAARPLAARPAMDTLPPHATDPKAALASHPELELMTRREEVAAADVALARAKQRADWTIELMYGRRGPDFSNMMSVNVSRPLQLRERYRQDREVAAKEALVQQARAQREEATREHLLEATGLLAAWNGNRARLEHYASTLVPLAEERTLAATAAYRGGSGTLTDALEARIAEIATRLDELMLASETDSLWAELTFLVPDGTEHGHE